MKKKPSNIDIKVPRGCLFNLFTVDEFQPVPLSLRNAACSFLTTCVHVPSGDGMGVTTTSLARIFKAQERNLSGNAAYLSWENFPHASLSRVRCRLNAF